MMQNITHLGTGEAFDDNLPNNSMIVSSQQTELLLDCGFNIPQQVWKYSSDPYLLDAIYISHLHADHYFGLPALLTRMWEEGRENSLSIITAEDNIPEIKKLLELGYKGFPDKFKFDINYLGISSGYKLELNDLELSFAPTEHSAPNLAVRVSDGKNNFCYSGDGMFTEETEKLYEGTDLLIHEAYLYDEKKIGHACITDLIEMAKRRNVKYLVLTHLQRDFRRSNLSLLEETFKKETNFGIHIPCHGDILIFNE